MIAAGGDGGHLALNLLGHVEGLLDVVAPGVHPAVGGDGGGALVGDGQVNDIALDLLGDVGVGGGLGGQGDHLAVLGQDHDDVGAGGELVDVALDPLGVGDAQQVFAAPVVHLALFGQGQGDLVAGQNLLDVVAAGAQLHGDVAQTHSVVAPGEDLALLIDGHHVVQTGGDLNQLAGLAGAGDVFQLLIGEGAPLVDVAVLVQAHGEGAAHGHVLGVALEAAGYLQHAEAGGHVGLGHVLIVQVNGEKVGQDDAAKEDKGEQDDAGHGDLIPDKGVERHLHGALKDLVLLLRETAHHHALGRHGGGGAAGGFFLLISHCLPSFSSRVGHGDPRWCRQCPSARCRPGTAPRRTSAW